MENQGGHLAGKQINFGFNHFSNLIGTPSVRTRAINWEDLGYAHHDLEDLDAPFTAQEIKAVIKDMPSEKAPGPDGFIGCFYKKCWSIIKDDVIQAIMSFFSITKHLSYT
jgi:hypothetical protein